MRIDRTVFELILARKGMTQAELAKKCGFMPQNVSGVLRRGTCTPRTAGRLAAGLGVPVETLTGKEGDTLGALDIKRN